MNARPSAMPGDDDARVREIAAHVRAIMVALHLDLDDPNLRETPERVAQLSIELFVAPGDRPPLTLSSTPNTDRNAQVVSVTDIPLYGMCPHHFLPFFGRAHVGYMPGKQIVGLGELARAVGVLARRPQLQEQLGERVVACLERELQPAGAIVVLQARHLCMEMRGERTTGALATTTAVRGVFDDPATRAAFLRGVRPQVD